MPFMALAKELKHRYPSLRVSLIVSEVRATYNMQQQQHDLMRFHRQYGVETVKKQLSPFGVEALSMGSPPWSYEEDLKLAPSVRALSHQHLSHHLSLAHTQLAPSRSQMMEKPFLELVKAVMSTFEGTSWRATAM